MKHLFLLAIQGLVVLGASASFAESTGDEADESITSSIGAAMKPKPPTIGNGAAIAKAAEELNTAIKMADPATAQAVLKDYTYLKDYLNIQTKCAERESTTNFICREDTNPSISKSLPIIQGIISAMGAGVKDSCSSFAKAMSMANRALLLYQASCATAKGLCESACGDATAKLKVTSGNLIKAGGRAHEIAFAKLSTPATAAQAQKDMTALTQAHTSLETAVKEDLEKANKVSVVAKYSTCSSYNSQIASAMTGGIGVLVSLGKANECDNKTTATALASATPVDCTIAANKANNMECICKDAPRTPGCAGGLDTAMSANSANSMRSADMAGYTPGAAKANTAMDNDVAGGLGAGPIDGSAGTSAAGAPISGGKGVDGGSGLNSGGPGQANAKSGTGLNTNILGGEGGGGGGGGGGYGSGSDGGSGSGLRQFLPKRGLAAEKLAGNGASVGVTAPGGKSNWEKIRERYRDNNSMFLGN